MEGLAKAKVYTSRDGVVSTLLRENHSEQEASASWATDSAYCADPV